MHYSDTDLHKCIAENDDRWDATMIAKAMLDERAEFKNFHRKLCERFGYTHDDTDWKRDQVSLIEWVATRRPNESPYVVVADAIDCFWNASMQAVQLHQDNTANAVMYGLVEGLAAIGVRLREQPEKTP